MTAPYPQVEIHLSRLTKPPRVYHEGLVADDGMRVRTFSVVPHEISLPLSLHFQQQGFLAAAQRIASVSKWLFYHEFFTIVEFFNAEQTLLGYYCDIATPLQKIGNEYHLTDLILDLWLTPDLRTHELDHDEFSEAVEHGLVDEEYRQVALSTMDRLRDEIRQGIFPAAYLK